MDNPYNNIYKSIITSFSDLIKIELNKEFYLAGDEIKGNIIFDNINNIKVNDITIFLYQKESWFVQETSEVKYGEKNNQLLCKYIIDLKEYLNNNEILVPGKYIFPFQLKLPDDLEPSFEYPYPNRYSYLRYSLICESNPNLPEIKHQKFILIKSLSYNILPQNSFSSIKNVHKWGFLDGGTTILKVSYEKGNYQINNLVPLNVDIDNSRGKLKVKECKIRVIRTIEFSKSKGPEKYPLEKTINSQVFLSEVLPYNKKNFLFQIQLIDNDLVDFKYIKEEKPFPNINDLNVLLPTLDSKLLKCDYRIQVSLYFDNFVTSGYRPRVKLPIIISHFFGEENNNINKNNHQYNLIDSNSHIYESSLLYDQNIINDNSENNIINDNRNINISNIINRENDIINDDLTEYIKSNKLENQKQNKSQNSNNNKINFIEMKKEFYNINEV